MFAQTMGGKKNSSVYIFGHNLGYDIIATGGIPILCQQGFRVTNFLKREYLYIADAKTGKNILLERGEKKNQNSKDP